MAECERVEELSRAIPDVRRPAFRAALDAAGVPAPNGPGDTLTRRLMAVPRPNVLQLEWYAERLTAGVER